MTKLLYMKGFDITECDAVVVLAPKTELGYDVVLDQTCFYPKGGGQDHDTGTIRAEGWSLSVQKVYTDEDGQVHHVGAVAPEGVVPSGGVTCEVNITRRIVNTRLHSAGHCIDMAMAGLMPAWVPGKGAHYPDMAFVEYSGEYDLEQRDKLVVELQEKLNILTSTATNNELTFMSKDELSKVCRHVPEYIPSNKPTRVVMYGDFGVPCGGTHVKSLDEIGEVAITKIKNKNGNIRVSYSLAD